MISVHDLIHAKAPLDWSIPATIQSDNKEYPGRLTADCRFLALSLVKECYQERPGGQFISNRQLMTLYLLAHSEAIERRLYKEAKRGRKNLVYHHMATGSILRGHGFKLGRFQIGVTTPKITRQFGAGSVVIAYILPAVNASQVWSERPAQLWVLAKNGDILKHKRITPKVEQLYSSSSGSYTVAK